MSAAAQLEVRDLSKAFGGVHAVEGLKFAIAAGAVQSIIGPNGAGKTTLLNLLTGVYAPSAGSIRFEGRELAGLPPHVFAAAGIGRTFQTPQTFFNMSALENVMVGRHRHAGVGWGRALLRLPGVTARERATRDAAAELMSFVGLGRFIDARADALPYGALKRLEVARALAAEPRFMLMDEPAAGLNPSETAELDRLIARIAARGVTVVLVEHNMHLVMGVSDHILVLDRGRQLAEGDAATIRDDPRVIEAYLGAAEEAA